MFVKLQCFITLLFNDLDQPNAVQRKAELGPFSATVRMFPQSGSLLVVLKLTCEVGPWEVYRDSGRVFNSALELKVHRKRIPLVGLALTLQLMEAISPCATPYTIFWSAPHTGLSR